MSMLNPNKLEGLQLYDLNKGCKEIAISPWAIQFLCYDELHVDLNMSLFWIKASQRIIACCKEGMVDDPPELKWKLDPDMKVQEERAAKMWMMKDKEVTGFTPSVSNLSANPGEHARMLLCSENREDLMTILPDCVQKQKLLHAWSLFDKLRKIYRASSPTMEERYSFRNLGLEFCNFLQLELPWMNITSLGKIITSNFLLFSCLNII